MSQYKFAKFIGQKFQLNEFENKDYFKIEKEIKIYTLKNIYYPVKWRTSTSIVYRIKFVHEYLNIINEKINR